MSEPVEFQGKTIPDLLHRNATEYGSLPALSPVPADAGETLSWQRVREEVAGVARGLGELGLGPSGRMLIMMCNRQEHWIVDLAAEHLRALPCTAYATLSTDEIRYVARHSASHVVVLEGADELKRWLPVLDDLPALRKVVMLDESVIPEGDDRFIGWNALRERGKALHADNPDVFERQWRQARPDDPVCMIYTSGTTGDPKGVVLSHRNVLAQAAAVYATNKLRKHPESVAYLPLAHIAERDTGMYMPIAYVGHVHICPDPAGVFTAMTSVRPNYFFGVPRVWEKLVAGLQSLVAAADETRRSAFRQASELATQAYDLRAAGKEVPADLAERAAAADAQVLLPIRQMLGLDRLTVASSGAAPIPYEVLRFMVGIGVEVRELWGLSETAGAATVNSSENCKLGTVGRPIADVELRLAEDNEIFVRGPIVFLGYLRTDGSIAPATDGDGWLATGDIGTIDVDGFLTITDRKKELIITSSGKNIAPTKIEGLLRAHPLIGNAATIGDRRPFVTALITLDEEVAPNWARARGIDITDLATLARHPEVLAEIDTAVAAANQLLARIEQIKCYQVLQMAWTPQSGELTPTLKLRRRIISERYKEVIEDLYTRERESG